MKAPALLFLSILFGSECFGQLEVDAGIDTAVCADITGALSVGGNPTAKGGMPPYTYSWSGSFEYGQHTYNASDVLVDTTVANPEFKEGEIPDSIVLHISVRDANENTATDSVRIRKSSYVVCLGECIFNIDSGDSIQLEHCISGGIPPLSFAWTPAESLSDSTLENPWAKPISNTSYTLLITDSIGCQTSSSCQILINPSGEHFRQAQYDILLFPNPSSSIITVEFNCQDYSNSTFEILSISGKIVSKSKVRESTIYINCLKYEPGIYFYKWKSDTKILDSGKILIE